MKLLLIVPRKDKHEREFFDFRFTADFIRMDKGFWGVPLAIPTVAALTPGGVDVRIVDENVETVPLDYDCDMVGITVMSLQAVRAYQLADHFRERGIKVILGGVHVSMLPDEAKLHADSVFVGEAEGRWAEVMDDFKKGELKEFYRPADGSKPDLSFSPPPRRELLNNMRYVANMMQTSRGCPFNCDFCSVQDFLGSKMRYKTPEQITTEVEEIYKVAVHDNYIKQLFLTDDNLVGNRERAMELFTRALIPLNEKYDISGWTCQCSINVARDLKLLELMKRAGCQHIFIGFETLDEKNLKILSKGINKSLNYSEAISTIRSYGIDVIGSFILGNDNDTLETFPKLVEFIDENNLLDNLINILVPFPGTKLFRRMKEEGRILHYDWSKYDLGHVVFTPKNMTPEQLEEGYIWCHEQVYNLDNLYGKLKHHIWKPGKNKVKWPLKLKFTLRMLSYLSATDWDRTKFIFRSIPDIYRPNLAMQVSNIVNCLDHQDFAKRLRVYRSNTINDISSARCAR